MSQLQYKSGFVIRGLHLDIRNVSLYKQCSLHTLLFIGITDEDGCQPSHSAGVCVQVM